MNAEAVMFALLRTEVCGGDIGEEIKSALSSELLEAVFILSDHHDMAHIIGHTLGKIGVLRDDEVSQKFKKQALQAVYRYANLNAAYVQICKALESAKIPFIPLKGSVLREYYPEPWMRTSCDIDILVKEQDLEQAIKQLERFGYDNHGRSMYDVSLFSPNGIHVELHFNLITDYVSTKQGEILSHMWKCVILVDGFSYKYAMPDEMFYFYHIAHMAKHFKEGGCGIRPFLDLWILNHRMECDMEKRQWLLAQGELLTFSREVEQLSEVWFSGTKGNTLSREIAQFVLKNGTYGTYEARVTMRQNGKRDLQYIWFRIFLPYRYLKYHYPVLQKQKWLLPAFEVVRWAKLIFDGGLKRSAHEMKTVASVSEAQRQNAVDLLDALGL